MSGEGWWSGFGKLQPCGVGRYFMREVLVVVRELEERGRLRTWRDGEDLRKG